MGERRPAQFSGSGLPYDTKLNRVPGVVKLSDVSFHVRESITDKDDEVRHGRSEGCREKEQKGTRRRQRPLKLPPVVLTRVTS